MSRPFTYISSTMYYDLEVYFFKLSMYTDSEEYSKLSVVDRNKIDHEIMNMDNILIVMRMFRQIPSTERAIIAWKKFRTDETEYKRIFRFSSSTVASKCLGADPGKILSVCKGERNSTQGYVFHYDDEDQDPAIYKRQRSWLK